MTVEAHLAPDVEIVGSWTLNTHFGPVGAAAGSWHDIHAIPFKARKGHAYLIDVTAVGFMSGAGTERTKYNITVDGPNVPIVEQDLGFIIGGWAALLNAQIGLTGIYQCAADVDARAVFRWWTQAANTDWVLDEGKHSMTVLDLGPQP